MERNNDDIRASFPVSPETIRDFVPTGQSEATYEPSSGPAYGCNADTHPHKTIRKGRCALKCVVRENGDGTGYIELTCPRNLLDTDSPAAHGGQEQTCQMVQRRMRYTLEPAHNAYKEKAMEVPDDGW